MFSDLFAAPPIVPPIVETDDEIDTTRILTQENTATNDALSPIVADILQTAMEQNEAFEQRVATITAQNTPITPNEIEKQVKKYGIKDIFKATAARIQLPQFYIQTEMGEAGFFGESTQFLEKETILKDFALGKSDTNISFETVVAELYKVDLDDTTKYHTPTFVRIDGQVKEYVMTYMLDPSRKDSRVKNFTKRLMELIGNLYPIGR